MFPALMLNSRGIKVWQPTEPISIQDELLHQLQNENNMAPITVSFVRRQFPQLFANTIVGVHYTDNSKTQVYKLGHKNISVWRE